MSETRLKIAVFIDFDNVEIGVKTTLGLQFDVGAVLEAIKEHGEIITKVAYGDWKRAGDHGRAMAQHAVRLVQRVMTPGGDKNGADINLALDALEMAFTHDHINAFVIVGGDSDFITLVEKLKQYDKKVFVVGGRAFTSQVMQKNCTQFIAYENVAPDRRSSAGTGSAPVVRAERGGRSSGPSAPLEQAFPLVKRALKVLADREVTPQLGLLKSTLLQLDSSFSERDYGASTFRDFAEKLSERGFVSLKHAGRSTHVELSEGAEAVAAAAAPAPVAESAAESAPSAPLAAAPAASTPPASQPSTPSPAPRRDDGQGQGQGQGQVPLSEGVAMVRRVLFEAPSPPRWPLYLRQMKQFLRNGQPDFDERKYGSIVELMRACQREGIVRVERDRQGGLRVFAGPSAYRSPAEPQQTWVLPDDREVQALEEAAAASLRAVDAAATESGWSDEAPSATTAAGDVPPLETQDDDDEAEGLQPRAAATAAQELPASDEDADTETGADEPDVTEAAAPELPLDEEPAPLRKAKRARRSTRAAEPDTDAEPDGNRAAEPADEPAPKAKRARKSAAKTARKRAATSRK